jgi:foldase protein PrsA
MKKKIVGLFLTICFAASLLSGCRIGDTEIKLEAGQLKNHKSVLKINNEKCDSKTAKLYLCNYRNLYGNAYGVDLREDEDLEAYAKEVTIQELSYIICMDLLAKEQGMSLDNEELELVEAAAKEYYESLNDDERSFMGVSERDVQSAYEDYALAKKLYQTLTQGIDEEVSDDEARVIRVQQIHVKDEATAEEIEKKLAEGSDFAAVAGTYHTGGAIDLNVARGDYPQVVENVAFNLDDGACSERIDTDDGYYFIKCISRYEEDLTEANKQTILQTRQKEQFEDSYQKFVDAATFQMNDTLWDEITMEGISNLTTDSFFSVYDKYFDQTDEKESE